MSSSFTELRHLFKGFDGRIASLEAAAAGEDHPLLPEERDHSEIFSRWLRQPTDHGIKAALQAAEDDLAGRALVKAEQELELANWRYEEARKAAEADFNAKTKRLVRQAELETIRKRIAFEDARKKHEVKDISIGTGATGGFAVPKEIAQRIARRTAMLNPFRRLARTDQAASSDYKVLLDLNNAEAGWIGEAGTRTTTGTPQLREITPTFGELYATATASEWSLADIFFDVEGWLVNAASDQFARLEADAVVDGDGSDKITGFLDTAPSLSADDASPPRSDAQLQYIAATGSPLLIAEDFSDLLAAFADGYLETPGAAWVVHRNALAQIRGLSFPNNSSFVESTAPGMPAMLLGLPLFTTAAMPAPGASGFPVSVGDWDRGFALVDRAGLRITFDEVSTPGRPRFYIRRRVAGHVADNNAVKLLSF